MQRAVLGANTAYVAPLLPLSSPEAQLVYVTIDKQQATRPSVPAWMLGIVVIRASRQRVLSCSFVVLFFPVCTTCLIQSEAAVLELIAAAQV